ncbi:hypothetical protein CDAR_449111 [Caerostris darwini]|uniref:Uncharacterized protein n=1 Tax=Caerostris darwini TaxID=1538125 RepID=A0AAV4QRU1_9ARAC|nr:hypothetical protein CDAR_449111 [Caerostris darwini]
MSFSGKQLNGLTGLGTFLWSGRSFIHVSPRKNKKKMARRNIYEASSNYTRTHFRAHASFLMENFGFCLQFVELLD